MKTGTVLWENNNRSGNQACDYLSSKKNLIVTGNVARHWNRIVLTVKSLACSLACVGLSHCSQKSPGQKSGLKSVLGTVPLGSLHAVNLFWRLRDVSRVNLGPSMLIGLDIGNISGYFNLYK